MKTIERQPLWDVLDMPKLSFFSLLILLVEFNSKTHLDQTK